MGLGEWVWERGQGATDPGPPLPKDYLHTLTLHVRSWSGLPDGGFDFGGVFAEIIREFGDEFLGH